MNFQMERPVLLIGVWVLVVQTLLVSGIEVREPENEAEVPPTSKSAALTATEPTDNGMAVGEAPEVQATEFIQSPEIIKKDEFPIPSAASTIDAVFPENHKNFTGSPYLGTIESPPHLSAYNKYQQQYREYYAQKAQYTSPDKPIKFQDNVPQGLGSYSEESSSEVDVRFKNKPFPYFYEGHSTLVPSEQPAYSIPEHDELETTTESRKPAESPMFPSFPFGNLFGGEHKSSSQKHHHHHGHHLQGQRSEVAHKHKSSGSWKKIFKVLTTVVPFGLFLATLTPNLLYINSTEVNKPSRQRSLNQPDLAENRNDEEIDPLVELVERFGGLEAMEDPQCEDRFFCEMSVLGQNEGSNFVEKGFWYLANETPDDMAQEVGMKELFHAIKSKSCEVYNCKQKRPETITDAIKEDQDEKYEENKSKKPKKFKKTLRL